MPELVAEAGVGEQFQEAMARSGALYDSLLPDYPEQAPYAVSMAYRLRYSMQFNAREAIHMLELRSAPQGLEQPWSCGTLHRRWRCVLPVGRLNGASPEQRDDMRGVPEGQSAIRACGLPHER